MQLCSPFNSEPIPIETIINTIYLIIKYKRNDLLLVYDQRRLVHDALIGRLSAVLYTTQDRLSPALTTSILTRGYFWRILVQR